MLWKKEPPKEEKSLLLPEGYLSSVCEVKTMNNELMATGVISEITPEYIQIADRANTMLAIPFGAMVKVNILNNRLGYRVMQGKVYLSSSEFLRLVELEVLLDHERRTFFRVRTNIRGKIFWPGELSRAEPGAHVVVEDLSVGGALLRCSEKFIRGDRLIVRFMLVNLMMQLEGVICRVVQKDAEDTHYGFEFESPPSAQQDALCAYLFQRQREQLNQRRK